MGWQGSVAHSVQSSSGPIQDEQSSVQQTHLWSQSCLTPSLCCSLSMLAITGYCMNMLMMTLPFIIVLWRCDLIADEVYYFIPYLDCVYLWCDHCRSLAPGHLQPSNGCTNYKDVFVCTLCFHAHWAYLHCWIAIGNLAMGNRGLILKVSLSLIQSTHLYTSMHSYATTISNFQCGLQVCARLVFDTHLTRRCLNEKLCESEFW